MCHKARVSRRIIISCPCCAKNPQASKNSRGAINQSHPVHVLSSSIVQMHPSSPIGIMHYILLCSPLSISFFAVAKCSQVGALMRSSLLLHLQKQRSTKHTDSRQRASSHGSRSSGGALRSSRARSAGRAGVDGSSSDANAVASGSLHASAGASGHGGSDDGRSSSASLAARPGRPRRIGAPGTLGPAAPGGSRARAAAPPACPRAFGPGA